MYDINIKNIKKGKRFYLIFAVVGFIFLAIMGGIYLAGIKKLNSLKESTMSIRVDINSHIDDEGSTMYSPTYYYVVRDTEYACGSTSSSSKYPGNENKLVYYDPENPANCMSEYSKSSNNILLFFLIIPIAFIAMGLINISKVNKRIKQVKELNEKGKLVKGLKYTLEDTGAVKNDVRIQRPVVQYTLSSGSIITLKGDPRFDNKTFDADGLVDLIIDESNPDNYFIDFEINRLTGNTPSDYYKGYQDTNTQQNVTSNNINQSIPNQMNNINQNISNNNIQQNTINNANQNVLNNDINQINNIQQ